jgi:hypothetical protein
MQRKVQAISQRLAETLSEWPEVEAVVLGEAAESWILDPYFVIPLDVYHHFELPPGSERRALFGSPPAFESLPGLSQDRFLISDLPVRVRYQEVGRFVELLDRIEAQRWVFHDAPPGLFHRLVNGQPLYRRTAWVGECRDRLNRLPDHYWNVLQEGSKRSFAYALTDLQAAAMREDSLFFALSLSRFLLGLLSFLFALNRRFEPPARLLSKNLTGLARLPDGFGGRFESLLREEPELTRERKCEIAGLLARSVLAMV